MRRRLLFVLAGTVAAVAALALLVHAPFVRRAVLRYALSTVQQRYGLSLEASRLDYNLAAMRIGLADLRVSAAAGRTPFFEADYVSVVVPGGTLLGDVSFDDVSVRNGLVRIVRTADGATNLPAAGEGGEGEPAALRIARLAIVPLRVDLRDEGSGFALDVPAATVELTEEHGRIALTSAAGVRFGDRSTRITRLEGDARFDGRTLHLSGMNVEALEGRARLDGPLTLIAGEPSIDLQVAGEGDLARLARWGIDGDVPGGTATFYGRVRGPAGDPAAEMAVLSPRVTWGDVTLLDAAVRARLTSDLLTIESAEFDMQGGHVSGSARVPFDGEAGQEIITRLAADAVIQLTSAPTPFSPLALPGESQLAVNDGNWRLDGRHRLGGVAPAALSLRGRLAPGDLMRSTVAGTVTMAGTDVAALLAALRRARLVDVPADAAPAGRVRGVARVSGTFAGARVAFDAQSDGLSVATPAAAGPAVLAGTFDTGTQRYTFETRLTDWLVTPTADLPLAGRFDATFGGQGRAANVTAGGDIVARDVAWDEVAVGDVTARVDLAGETARVAAQAPRFPATVAATIATRAPYAATIEARAENLDLTQFTRRIESPVDLAGTATVTAVAMGPLQDWRAGTARVEVSAFDATAGSLPIRLREPAVVRYEGERVTVERLEADAGDTLISASGDIAVTGAGADAGGIVATITGDVDEVARAIAATGLTELPISGGTGPVALLARVGGSLEAPAIAADLEMGPGSIALRDLPPLSDLRVRSHVEDGWLELREAQATYQGAVVSGTGRIPLAMLGITAIGVQSGDATLRARATGITAAVLEPFVDPGTMEEVSGSIDATLALDSPSLDLAALRGALQLDRLDLRVADLPVAQRVPTRIVARDGFARIEAWDWTGQGATLGLAGQVRLSDRQAAVLANGEVDLRMLTPFVRDAGLTTAGSVRPRLSITGDLADPRIDGDLLLSSGEVRLVDPRILATDLAGRAVLTRSTATLTMLTGTVNGGALTGEGRVEFRPDAQLDIRLAADIRGMALEFPEGLRSELNAALELTIASGAGQPAPGGRLGGTVTVVRGSYREPLAVVTGVLAGLRAARVTGPVGAPGILDTLALDVRLVTDEEIVVDNNYGRFQLGADLRLIGTAAVPALSGRAELREGGQLFVGRNVYTITAGAIDFANPDLIEPDMNIVLETQAGGEDIEVTITGTPETASVTLQSSSDTTLGQAELASLLLTGRRIDELASTDAAVIGAQVLGNLSADVLGFAGRAIGLDTLRIGGVPTTNLAADPAILTTDLDPTSRLTFGKALGNDVDVTFSQSLRDGDAQTWLVEYLPSRRIQLRFLSDDEDDLSAGFRHDVTFGGPRRRAARAAAEGDEPAVASVTIEGELRFPEPQLRGLLSLDPGNTFDFADFQADRDRLADFYQSQGYLTARVAAARSGDDRVALTYTVTPGPRTEIVVTGAELTPEVRAELQRAWTGSVFDSFLIDETTEIVRRALAAEGFLQARVTAALTGSADAATLTLSVEPGIRTTAVRTRVEGVDNVLAAELTQVVATAGLDAQAATNPGAVEDAITEYLRRAGYVRARTTVGAPRFDGAGATVPVTVTPGEPLVFGPLTFEGVERLPVEQLREAAAIPEGAPADPAVVDAARGRILSLYRAEGFAGATVTPRQALRAGEPHLDVTFVVREGPRQVLTAVAIEGNSSIDTDVIERALRLPLGEPLRPREWLQARTRVFDTGLFRRVDVSAQEAGAATPEGVLPMRMRVAVEEWPALRARYGLQVTQQRPEDEVNGTDLVPGVSGDVTRRTVFGRAVTIGAAGAFERRERLGRVFLNAPTMAGLPVRSALILQRSRREFAAATLVTDTSTVAWEQRVRATSRLTLSYAYRFERNHTVETNPTGGEFDFDVLVQLARLTSSAAFDTRDDPVDTRRGSLLSTSVDVADTRLGSDFAYVRSLSQAYYFKPWRGVVFASAARVGVVQALAEQEVIPSVRFFAGGARSVRGVEEDGLGPRNFFGDPIGGTSLIVFNQEVRFPMYRWLGGVAFVDAGSVSAERRFDFGGLTTAVGAGLRVYTPLGVLRADYGRVVSSGPQGSGRFTFGIGQTF